MAPQHLALMLLVCTIWGFNFVAAKVGVQELPPLLFTGLRLLILTVVLLPFLRPARGRMGDVLVIVLFNGAIHFGLMFIGLAMTGASVAAVVAQLNVPSATVLSIIFLDEVVRRQRWGGIALAFIGVRFVSFDPHVFDARSGVMFATGAALSGAIAVCIRRLTKVGVFQLQAWTAVITAPLLLSASLLFESRQMTQILNAQPITWGPCCSLPSVPA